MPTQTSFEQAVEQIGRRPQLTEKEELALAAQARRGNRAAAHALVEAHLPIVLRQAKRLRGYGVPIDELMAEGNLGLLRAVEKFEKRGVRFKTYATYWVRAFMLSYVLRTNSMVTVATGAVGAKFFFKLRSARAKAETLLGNDVDVVDEHLAAQFGVSVEQIRQHTARLNSHDSSLDVPVGEDADSTRLDLMPTELASPEENCETMERNELVHETLRRMTVSLDARERAVLERRLLSDEDDVTLSNLGSEFGLSRERLRQIEARLKQRLERALQTADLMH